MAGSLQIKLTSFYPAALDATQSGISIPLVVFKFGFNYNREVSTNCPMECGNAMLVPPFTSYKRGRFIPGYESPPFLFPAAKHIPVHFNSARLSHGR
jgi:hypothetical protein